MQILPEICGEWLGTMFLIILGTGVVANVLLSQTKGHASGWITITTGWFIAVVIGVFVTQSAGSINADINPAVSFVKYLSGHYTLLEFLVVTLAQISGAFCGAVIVWLAYWPHWSATPDPAAKLAVFSTMPAIKHTPGNLMSEIIGTAVLVIGVSAIFGHATWGRPADGLGPYLVGLLVWGIGISLGGPTGYAVNPARDLGPRLAHAVLPIAGKGTSGWSYAWIPVLGPMIGAAMGLGLWRAIS